MISLGIADVECQKVEMVAPRPFAREQRAFLYVISRTIQTHPVKRYAQAKFVIHFDDMWAPRAGVSLVKSPRKQTHAI
jgi:hypothetical protein